MSLGLKIETHVTKITLTQFEGKTPVREANTKDHLQLGDYSVPLAQFIRNTQIYKWCL